MLSSGIYLDHLILTETELLAIYSAAIALITEGKTIMSWGGEGTTATKQFVANPLDIAREARHALKTKLPQKYGYITNRSRVIFT